VHVQQTLVVNRQCS